MRVLMLCTKYPLDPNDRFMTNELAGALVAAGHRVQVVVTDWDAPFGAPTRHVRSEDCVDAIVLSPRGIAGLGSFVGESQQVDPVLAICFARDAKSARP